MERDVLDRLLDALPTAAAASACVLAIAAMIGIARRDNSVVDAFWGLAILAAAWAGALAAPGGGAVTWLAMAMVATWGLRLAWHIGRRKLRSREKEDWRYASWREQWGDGVGAVLRSLAQVYALQALLALLVASCVLVIAAGPDQAIGPWAIIGVLVWAAGLALEAAADSQLARFVSRKRRGEATGFLRSGLWAHSRHPNYFGEAVAWWGLALLALDVDAGWVASAAFLSPVVVTVLVRFVSGVPILERAWRTRPGFVEWAAQVPVFVPRITPASQGTTSRHPKKGPP